MTLRTVDALVVYNSNTEGKDNNPMKKSNGGKYGKRDGKENVKPRKR